MVFIFGIIIALVIIVVLFMYMIAQPVPAATAKPTATGTTAPAAAQSTTAPTPAPAAKFKTYIGNNGVVSGNEYCKGVWESADNRSKNFQCVGGKNTATGALLDCSTVYGYPGGPYTYDCSSDNVKYQTYIGNNGVVSGNEYCKGTWESPTNTNKNLNCISGHNETSNTPINCSSVYGLGPKYTYICG